MTKKDYIKIAIQFKNALALSKLSTEKYSIDEVITAIINDFSEMLKEDNQNFDKQKFIEYINK